MLKITRKMVSNAMDLCSKKLSKINYPCGLLGGMHESRAKLLATLLDRFSTCKSVEFRVELS